MADDELERAVYDCSPVMLLSGNNEVGLARAARAADRAQCRVSAICSIDDAPARLELQAAVRVAMVLADEPSLGLQQLLVHLDAEARSGRLRPVIIAPANMIDVVAGAGLAPAADHLIDPTEDDLFLAIARAVAPASANLQDVTRSNGAGVLQQLSEEAARLASVLASLSSEEAGASSAGGILEEGRRGDQIEPGFVRSIIRARRLRDQYFRGELFADPAWDMLLDLFAARLEGNRVAVSSLCIAAAVPATTALRWIKALTDRGLLVRAADPRDGRRVYVELAPEAAKAMAVYFAMAQRLSPAII